MKIKAIKKYEDDARIINVNFVTSMIENSQVTIGMKYFLIEFFNKQRMGYDVGIALDEEALVKELSDCTYGMDTYLFKRLIDDVIDETPKFCYVYDNIWKYVLERKYFLGGTVKFVENAISRNINAYHNCKLYNLLTESDRKMFEGNYPENERKVEYRVLGDVLWDWFNTLTKGKYELVDETLYNKVKKAEEKMTTLKYKELNEADLAEVNKFVESQIDDKCWYHNTGNMDITTADGRKLVISDIDTLDLAVGLNFQVDIVGDYIVDIYASSKKKLFKGADGFNPLQCVNIDDWFRRALKMVDYNENRFYEKSSPYGRLGYRFGGYYTPHKFYVTKVNEKSIQFTTSDSEEELEKRPLKTEWKNGKDYDSFVYFKHTIEPKECTNFSPEGLMEDARNRAKEYYEEAVEKFGEPVEQEVTEQELVAAASEAL